MWSDFERGLFLWTDHFHLMENLSLVQRDGRIERVRRSRVTIKEEWMNEEKRDQTWLESLKVDFGNRGKFFSPSRLFHFPPFCWSFSISLQKHEIPLRGREVLHCQEMEWRWKKRRRWKWKRKRATNVANWPSFLFFSLFGFLRFASFRFRSSFLSHPFVRLLPFPMSEGREEQRIVRGRNEEERTWFCCRVTTFTLNSESCFRVFFLSFGLRIDRVTSQRKPFFADVEYCEK